MAVQKLSGYYEVSAVFNCCKYLPEPGNNRGQLLLRSALAGMLLTGLVISKSALGYSLTLLIQKRCMFIRSKFKR